MKIVLISPSVKRTYRASPEEEGPLGLGYLASMVKDKHEVRIVDGFIRNLSVDEIEKEVCDFNPQVIGISTVFTSMVPRGMIIAAELKQRLPEAKIILGGTHATFTAGKLIKNKFVDYIVLGEGEFTFKELIDRVENNAPINDVKGIVYKEDVTPIFTAKREPIYDLDGLPFPVRCLSKSTRKIITSRGCPYNCIYCLSTAMWGRKWRARNPENVIREIKYLVRNLGANKIVMADDNFTVSRDRVIEFCHLIKKRKLNFDWSCTSRIEKVDKELLSIMRKAGCGNVLFGVESGCDKILRRLKRGYNSKKVKEVFSMCSDIGIRASGSFIIGFPWETKEDVLKSFELAEDLRTDSIAFHVLTPYIGTKVYERAEEFGIKILTHDEELFDTNYKPIIETEHLKRESLADLYYQSIGLFSFKKRKISK